MVAPPWAFSLISTLDPALSYLTLGNLNHNTLVATPRVSRINARAIHKGHRLEREKKRDLFWWYQKEGGEV